MTSQLVTVDGNQAAAHVAYALNEVICIYPITPASPMGELADSWATASRPNAYGSIPQVIEMQSEGGAAGAVHGALQAGALTTTFTASQGLLLMLPNMYKIAGELTPTVFHIASRSIATHALSIFGDHSDVMAARATGWAMLCSASVQEAQDFALIAQAATLQSRVPFLHFFDGFRTSHEINTIEQLTPEQMQRLIDPDWIAQHRQRALNPERPVLRGSAQNPDVFFQAREAVNPFYLNVPGVVQQTMDQFAEYFDRRYHLFDYVGAEDAERVICLMGSGTGAAEEAVEYLVPRGEKVGLIKVRLFRPFNIAAFLHAIPATTQAIAVLDRTKEPGSVGEPLYQDVVTALVENWPQYSKHPMPKVIGGRFGLSSKEFTPAMAIGVLEELNKPTPKSHFTIGIHDDVTHTSLPWDEEISTEAEDVTRAVFYGLGSDGTVGSCKNTVKIINEHTSDHAQGYFVYDSKKAGSVTISHLRFGPRPIRSSYLIRRANFVACHQFQFLERMDILSSADQGATFLLNSPFSAEEVWDRLPQEVQASIIDRHLRFYVVNASEVARQAGLGSRINSVMQTCFFALTELLPCDQAIQHIKDTIRESYQKRGESVVQQNFSAIDMALNALRQVPVPQQVSATTHRQPPVPGNAPDFVQRVTGMMIAGKGDLLPVSALPVDGTFPTGTAKYEKRSIAAEIPIWDPKLCTQCGLCAFVCPHAAIRTKAYPSAELIDAPESFASIPWKSNDHAEYRLTVQVAPDDCTGCGVCVDMCPARSKEVARHKSINMQPKLEHVEQERQNYQFFTQLSELERTSADVSSVKGSQLLQPLFEFSGACAGCGETPYLKLLTQLFGDRILVANATGCSSIFGGNLPTTPWSVNQAGCGPAWSNSLFEDNAEFGLGMELASKHQRRTAHRLLRELSTDLGDELVNDLLDFHGHAEKEIAAQRRRVQELRIRLQESPSEKAKQLLPLTDFLLARSIWIVGGDGWAYDIGYGGLDHVLASGQNVNILVLDTGVYSNTGGQASKATPRAAVAKFAAGGKQGRKKDLGLMAIEYGNVYVAQLALGANPRQAIQAFSEAESYPGPSLLIAYSQCIAHGVDLTKGMHHQKEATQCGFWPLYRYDPRLAHTGMHPIHLDSRKPSIPFKQYAMQEGRFAMLLRSNPTEAERLLELAQKDVQEQWHYLEQLAGIEREITDEILQEVKR